MGCKIVSFGVIIFILSSHFSLAPFSLTAAKEFKFSVGCDFRKSSLSISVQWEGYLRSVLKGECILASTAKPILAIYADLISKSFHCRTGKAYLFDKVVNVTTGEKEERMMMTGVHTVVDVFCVRCGSLVGWRYEIAHEKSQKYKEGKFILERFKVLGPDGSAYSMGHEDQISGSDVDDV
ncbi:Protein yippee-like [Forsythia ovata]|uniref:Protein yippee-like n=1 Tax=Forsythia ovata TaxID=205694 RepID=A0ABD1SLN8_9LAMI